ncbi:hypothetical protein BKA25_001525 [Actinoalloteichus hymeniacidonis]|uniref:Uncharacterized protein n=1 Tax=Actinoalloteichus hymeniacidonis TaxID=340345 RepID=A0AAC9HUF7_9PSEU|nr:hypothetical protein TL08_19620 [Actinoalloteichus hymeniacidonis]MBB5907209.1 hypothetical protein [Actinoalloteichus hymeniacidonis]
MAEMEDLFDSPPIIETVEAVERYLRKPAGSEDQGYKDED